MFNQNPPPARSRADRYGFTLIELPVVISGDRQVRYEVIIEVMSELQKMNINRIALMVRPPGSGK